MLALSVLCGAASAQSNANPQRDGVPESAVKSPANLIEATEQYKSSSREWVNLQEAEISKASAKVDESRQLVAEGLIARAELEASEQSLAALRQQLQATQQQIADSDHMIAEIRAEQQLAQTKPTAQVKLISKQYGGLSTTATILRYNGLGSWSLGRLGGIQAVFSATFGHSLPTSAIGQSATHDRLGYDHRNAVDVALHPDSPEGKGLIKYLQDQGVPFLAFRGAVPGVATGPHIHIGSPSHRLSQPI